MTQAPVLDRPKPITVRRESLALEKTLVVIITTLPFAAFVLALGLFWQRGISGVDIALLAGLYVFSGLGVAVGFHRHFAHKSFEAPRWLRVGLGVAGSFSVQGALIPWVADHRRHHAFSDQEGDPHSPHLEEAEGVRGVLRGLWHAHIGWFFDPERTKVEHYAPDLQRDKAILWVSRLFPLWTVLTFAIPALIGFAATGTWVGGATGLLWGGLVRVFFLHHVTWSINSICHFFGKRPYESRDLSTNNWVLSIVSFGESWHNNHHAFPSSAVHGFESRQIDISAGLIRALERAGVVRGVKRPNPEYMARKRRV